MRLQHASRQCALEQMCQPCGLSTTLVPCCAAATATPQGKTQAAAAAAPVDTVDDLMLKLAALGSVALGADPESAAAALAGGAGASGREKQPRRMKLLRQQVAALQEKQQQLEEEMDIKEQVRGRRPGCVLAGLPPEPWPGCHQTWVTVQ